MHPGSAGYSITTRAKRTVQRQGVLDEIVLERTHANRPCLTLILRDADPSDRLVPILLRPQPLVQRPEVPLQVLPVLLLGDPVHPHRRLLAQTAVGPLQRRHIDQMGQRMEPSLGLPLRSLRYLQKFR
jgi:hypothetical protein